MYKITEDSRPVHQGGRSTGVDYRLLVQQLKNLFVDKPFGHVLKLDKPMPTKRAALNIQNAVRAAFREAQGTLGYKLSCGSNDDQHDKWYCRFEKIPADEKKS